MYNGLTSSKNSLDYKGLNPMKNANLMDKLIAINTIRVLSILSRGDKTRFNSILVYQIIPCLYSPYF